MLLFPRISLRQALLDAGLGDLVTRVDAELEREPWKLLRVRRTERPGRPKQGKKPKPYRTRSLVEIARGARAEMLEALAREAERLGAPVSFEGGMPRAYIARRTGRGASVDDMLAVAPAVVEEKTNPRFAAEWEAITRQVTLFGPPAEGNPPGVGLALPGEGV